MDFISFPYQIDNINITIFFYKLSAYSPAGFGIRIAGDTWSVSSGRYSENDPLTGLLMNFDLISEETKRAIENQATICLKRFLNMKAFL